MEGLIPLVYKTLKKSQTRRKYECLSSGTATQPFDIADFYVNGGDREYIGRRGSATPGPDDMQLRGAHHRRSSSVAVDGRHGTAAPPPAPSWSSRCSDSQRRSELSVDKHGKVKLRSLKKLGSFCL